MKKNNILSFHRYYLIIFKIPFIFFLSCAGAYTPSEKMNEAAFKFYEAFRWGKTDEMSSFVIESKRQQFAREFGKFYSTIVIVDYDIMRIKIDNNKTAFVEMVFSWHRKDETIINRTTVRDSWVNKNGKWKWSRQEFLEGEKP